MTTMYSAHVEVDLRKEYDVDELMTKLEAYHAAVGMSPRGYADAQISLPAENLAQASTTAITVVAAAFGAQAIACEVLTEAEFDARQGWETVPDLVSVTEAAEILGVTRQAVQQRIESKSLPATRIGTGWAIPRSAVILAAGPTHPDYPFEVTRDIGPRSTRGRS